jgi:hypothetical protein
MHDWNVVVSLHEGGYTPAWALLEPLGSVSRTPYFNVLVMRVEDIGQFLETLRQRSTAESQLLTVLARVMPVTQTFVFQTVEEFEALALAIAQQSVGHDDLSAPGMLPCALVSSAEPCAMCFRALLWAGIQHLACGARAEDARAIGCDEGPKPAAWMAALAPRGIVVTQDIVFVLSWSCLADPRGARTGLFLFPSPCYTACTVTHPNGAQALREAGRRASAHAPGPTSEVHTEHTRSQAVVWPQ